MALGEINIFSWKNKTTREREQEEYKKWAFPYGEAQQRNLESLLLSLFPGETVSTTLIPFLTCKELFETALRDNDHSTANAIDMLLNSMKKYKRVIRKNEMSTYVALVMADREIDERSEYPSADVILKQKEELERLRR